FALAGVPNYAIYLLDRLFEPQRPIQDLVDLAAYLITETATQDGKVGGPVQLITITPLDGCVALDADTIGQIVRRNDVRRRAWRDSFYETSAGSERST